uniref:Uncharacterized protein n=1 Tax=Octopus bimaculoides TaxID=37653 RepID=A0A0L8HGS5_OCTBM
MKVKLICLYPSVLCHHGNHDLLINEFSASQHLVYVAQNLYFLSNFSMTVKNLN